jgi:tetratricopeptide (TPR) repeat protein
MKWVLKKDNISKLIEFGKERNYSENYLFVTTKDMLEQTEMNLDTFCTKIQPKTIISGFEEEIDKNLEKEIGMSKMRISKRALVIFSIKKELIDKETLQSFTSVDEKLLPIIQVVNSFDYEDPEITKRDLDWMVDKIHGKEIEFTDHIPTAFEITGTKQKEDMDDHYGYVKFVPPFEKFRPLTAELTTLSFEIEKKFGFSPKISKIQMQMLTLASKIDTENYQAVEQLAVCCIKIGKVKQAKELLLKCLEINPKFSAARVILAETYTELYQFSNALDEIKKIDLVKMPDVEKINIILIKARIKMIKGELDSADLEFQNANNIGKKTNENWKHLEDGLYAGWYTCQTEKGDYKRAIEVLEIDKQRDPNSVPTWNNLGMQYSLLGEYEKSFEAYEHAYKLDNRAPNVLMNLGLLYLQKDDDQTALKYYEKAKSSLEEGYNKFTGFDKDGKMTDTLLALTQKAITIIRESKYEDKENFINLVGGKIRTTEELFPLPPPPENRELEELEDTHKKCKKSIQNFIRKKYHSDPEKFRKDFNTNYETSKKILEQDKKKMHPQKNADLFSFIDTGVFPYIIRIKKDEWELEMDNLNLVSMLYSDRDMRNDNAHDQEITPRQKEIRFQVEMELIEFFERKLND